MSLENIRHFLRVVAYNGRFTLHVKAEGDDDRSKIEAISMAVGRALKNAIDNGSGDYKKDFDKD